MPSWWGGGDGGGCPEYGRPVWCARFVGAKDVPRPAQLDVGVGRTAVSRVAVTVTVRGGEATRGTLADDTAPFFFWHTPRGVWPTERPHHDRLSLCLPRTTRRHGRGPAGRRSPRLSSVSSPTHGCGLAPLPSGPPPSSALQTRAPGSFFLPPPRTLTAFPPSALPLEQPPSPPLSPCPTAQGYHAACPLPPPLTARRGALPGGAAVPQAALPPPRAARLPLSHHRPVRVRRGRQQRLVVHRVVVGGGGVVAAAVAAG